MTLRPSHTVLITGASRGLGRALHACYHDSGWATLPLVRRAQDADELRRHWPERCEPIVADIAHEDAIATIAESVRRSTDRLDLIINNAGNVSSAYTIDQVDPEELVSLLQVHCVGAARCVKAVLPQLRTAERSAVVNITSRLGSLVKNAAGEFADEPTSYAYRIAKAAQNMLTVCLAQDLKRDGIAVYGIHPGKLKTDIGADDAVLLPSEAARRIMDWLATTDASLSGQCFEVGTWDVLW